MEQTRDGAGRASAREEFAAAVTEHSHGMFRAARSILDSDADAEDAVDIDAGARLSCGPGSPGTACGPGERYAPGC